MLFFKFFFNNLATIYYVQQLTIVVKPFFHYNIYMKKSRSLSRKNLAIRIILIVAAVILLWYGLGEKLSPSNQVYVSYAEFYSLVEKGDVTFAKITGSKIIFDTIANNENAAHFFTDNPNSPSLHEFLLLNRVTVKTEENSGSFFSLIFDAIFYIFFFGIIIVVFRKFISPNTFRVVRKTGVTFDDVVGMENLKRDMKQVMDIMLNPADYAKRGIRMPKGILLEGAPGNGKTLFARALAGEAKVNFIPAKATDFESMFMAIGPMKVKLLFAKARKRAPCIVFIDEFDGIGTRRNYSGSAIETENTRIVTALLNELDGFVANNRILVIAATNSITALDEALIRPGRFDARFTVPYPDAAAREKLAEMYLRGKAHSSECTPKTLSQLFDKFSCAKIESVLNRAALIAGQAERGEFTLDDVKAAMKEQ